MVGRLLAHRAPMVQLPALAQPALEPPRVLLEQLVPGLRLELAQEQSAHLARKELLWRELAGQGRLKVSAAALKAMATSSPPQLALNQSPHRLQDESRQQGIPEPRATLVQSATVHLANARPVLWPERLGREARSLLGPPVLSQVTRALRVRLALQVQQVLLGQPVRQVQQRVGHFPKRGLFLQALRGLPEL